MKYPTLGPTLGVTTIADTHVRMRQFRTTIHKLRIATLKRLNRVSGQ